MHGSAKDVELRVAKVAKAVIKNAKIEPNRVSGFFSYSCGTNAMMGGNSGMTRLAENLSDSLGWVPSLAMCGGPEFGNQGGDGYKSFVGSYMFSAIVFSDVPVTEKLEGATFANRAEGMAITMQIGSSGHALGAEEA